MKVLVQVLKKNRLLLVFTCLTAGITEEIIFRGYLLPRLEILLK
jgi:membrane protease YdiL (CAAX protease family)